MASKEVQSTGRQVDEYLYEPPSVSTIQDLKDMYNQLKDTILVSIDFECTDHLPGTSYYERLSEVGMAWYDPRDDPSPSRKFTVEKALPKIRSVHCIMRKYKNFTADSCFAHKTLEEKSHKAMPYSCYFAKSYFCNREKAMAIIEEKMKWLSTRRLSRKEAAGGKKRKVIVLYWDARLETSVFREAGVDITAHGAEQWDFQLLRLFHMRFRRLRNKAENMLYSLGVSLASSSSPDLQSKGFTWHNATNDCWATVAGFLQVLSMAEQPWKWKRWLEEEKSDDDWEMILWSDSKERRAGTDLEALDMSWLDARNFDRNAALSPPPMKWPKDASGQRNSEKYEVDCIGILEFVGISQPESDLQTPEQQSKPRRRRRPGRWRRRCKPDG